jgi:hypothetical protein
MLQGPESQMPVEAVVLILMAALTALTIILLPVMRAFGRRLEGRVNPDSVLPGEVDALRQEVAELHERVDFAERVLLKNHDRKELGQGESAG